MASPSTTATPSPSIRCSSNPCAFSDPDEDSPEKLDFGSFGDEDPPLSAGDEVDLPSPAAVLPRASSTVAPQILCASPIPGSDPRSMDTALSVLAAPVPQPVWVLARVTPPPVTVLEGRPVDGPTARDTLLQSPPSKSDVGQKRSAPWEVVKSKGWWRGLTSGRFVSAPAVVVQRPPPSQAAIERYRKIFRNKCLRCLAFDHRVAQCRDPVRCLNYRKSGHIASSCPYCGSRRRQPYAPHAPATRTTDELVTQPPLCSVLHETAVFHDPLADCISTGLLLYDECNNPPWLDPMVNEASIPLITKSACCLEVPDLVPTLFGSLLCCGDCSGEDPNVVESRICCDIVSQPVEEVASVLVSNPELPQPQLVQEKTPTPKKPQFDARRMMKAFGEGCAVAEPQAIGRHIEANVVQEEVRPTTVAKLNSKVTRVMPSSLLGTPMPSQVRVASNPRRSGRLVQKNKKSNIPIAKRAEHRLMEAFGEISEVGDKEAEEDQEANNKMTAYLEMYKKPLTPKVIEALSVLAGLRGKAKIDLAALDFTAAELVAVGEETTI